MLKQQESPLSQYYNNARGEVMGLVKTRRLARHSLRLACSRPYALRTPARSGYAMQKQATYAKSTMVWQRAIIPRRGYGGRDGGLNAGMRMKALPKVTSGKGVRSPSRKPADALTSARSPR